MQELLFLCHRIPYPPDKGDKIRAFHILEHLARSFDVHLGCLADDPHDHQYLPDLKARCATVGCFAFDPGAARLKSLTALGAGRALSLDYFWNRQLAKWVAGTLRSRTIAQLFVFSGAMAQYVMQASRQVGELPRILDMVDIDSEKFAAYGRNAALPMRFLWSREARRLLAFERLATLQFDRTLFVSAAEEAQFLELAPDCAGRTTWVANGVDADYFSPDHGFPSPFASGERTIVFTGRMDYKPNIDAVLWFADAVLPRFSAPAPVFVIVGAEPVPAVKGLASRPGIRVTGRVADTRPYLAHASVVVAPLRIGRGIQNKVLEAMALGRPVVATPAAAEGIATGTERAVLVAADAPETARLAEEVLNGRHGDLGAAARRAVRRFHDWRTTLNRLDALLDQSDALRASA